MLARESPEGSLTQFPSLERTSMDIASAYYIFKDYRFLYTARDWSTSKLYVLLYLSSSLFSSSIPGAGHTESGGLCKSIVTRDMCTQDLMQPIGSTEPVFSMHQKPAIPHWHFARYYEDPFVALLPSASSPGLSSFFTVPSSQNSRSPSVRP